MKPTSAEIRSIKFTKGVPTQGQWERQELARLERLPPDKAPTDLLLALKMSDSVRDDDQKKIVAEAYAKAFSKSKSEKTRPADGDVVDLMIMQDIAKPRPNYLLLRGDYTRPDEKNGPLQPGVIHAVSAAFREPPQEFHNRLDLAQWLVSPDNPLTPRVTMNRVWMRYFGRGIVETEEDFGTQGSGPTHPELLDWLAREFIHQGWSLKKMHRLIVTSATYRQSSKARPDLLEKDPRNLLLARQERVRVEAEIVRDAALSASGLLNATIGGPRRASTAARRRVFLHAEGQGVEGGDQWQSLPAAGSTHSSTAARPTRCSRPSIHRISRMSVRVAPVRTPRCRR
ncbi:MAG: DUF1553 domain-containing protein [Chthoniobacter sp.]